MPTHPDPSKASPDAIKAYIEQWEQDLRRVEDEITGLSETRLRLRQQLSLAENLRTLIDSPKHQTSFPEKILSTKGKVIDHPIPTKVSVTVDSTLINAVESVVMAAELGITPADARDVLLQTPIGLKINDNEKGLHNALARLLDRQVVFRENGRYYSANALGRLMELKASGAIDEPPTLPRSAPTADAVMGLIQTHPGITSREIIELLESNGELETVNPNGIYNVIARFISRNEVEKVDGQLYPKNQS